MFKNKKLLIFTSLLTLLPIAAGLILWDKLPEQVPTHWNMNGEVDGWSSRGFAVFGLPLVLLAVHIFCLFFTLSDKRNQDQTKKVLSMMLWICPIISLAGSAAIYGFVLGYRVNMARLPFILMAMMLLVVGNYLPKCRHNYTIGIKLPWTLNSEENWNATHRLGGKVWVIGGILNLVLAFLPLEISVWMLFVVMALVVLIPTAYSYWYMKTKE